jgi:hydroxypyruvate reductase
MIAARRLLDIVSGLTADDLVVALVSGGGSALLPAPPEGLTLADEIAVNRALLDSGAPIGAMNAVRKHLSRIKGGRLAAAAWPATVVSLVVSDVPGDDPALVASGPTVPDRTTRQDALDLIGAWNIALPDAAMAYLATDAADAPMPDDPRFANNGVRVVASAGLSLEAACAMAANVGYRAIILSDSIEGEARDVAGVMAAMAREIATRNRPFTRPVLLLSGGETTVTIRNRDGKGGRNSEFMLAFAIGVEGVAGISAFAADTDGQDGTGPHAGAFADFESTQRMRDVGLDPRRMLAANLSATAFEAIDGLFATGPTGTNINDFRAILIE